VRWKIVAEYNLCDHCLQHPNRDTCYGLNDPRHISYECGVGGCKEYHHSTLHAVKETGQVGLTRMRIRYTELKFYERSHYEESDFSDEEIIMMDTAEHKKERESQFALAT